MNNKEKLNMLAMRALDELELNMESFSSTLAMILQEKLGSPEEPIRGALKRAFEAEEPLAWDGQSIPELKIIVLNDKCNKLLHFIDKNGDKLLVLKREELND